MSKGRHFGRVALAISSTVVIAACSSDMPTGPGTALQGLTTAAPTIGLGGTTLRLCYPDRPSSTRACHPTGYVTISNTGGGTLNWTSTKHGTWLRRSPRYGTAPSTMKVRVDGTDLPAGTYYGQIYVWATGATNSPQKVTVYFTRW
jgi:hypothetical protein